MSTPICMAQTSSYTEAELTRNNVKCKFKCRNRSFYSRGYFLVLIWIFASVNSQYFLSENLYSGLSTQFNTISWIVISVPLIVSFVCTLLCGWLADARFDKYRVFRTGTVLLFSAVAFLCLYLLVYSNKRDSLVVIIVIVFCLFLIGAACCIVTSLQLGLDHY